MWIFRYGFLESQTLPPPKLHAFFKHQRCIQTSTTTLLAWRSEEERLLIVSPFQRLQAVRALCGSGTQGTCTWKDLIYKAAERESCTGLQTFMSSHCFIFLSLSLLPFLILLLFWLFLSLSFHGVLLAMGNTLNSLIWPFWNNNYPLTYWWSCNKANRGD